MRNPLSLPFIRLVWLPLLFAAAGQGPPAKGEGEAARRILPESIRAVSVKSGAGSRIVRTELTEAELGRPMTVSMSLRMPNFPDFQARLARGQNLRNGGISRTEMDASYLPSAADYFQMRGWLAAQGLAIAQDDANHTTVFARGSVAQVAEAFHVSFARVATADGEFTSAVTAPSLPGTLPASILTVDGLQPPIRAHTPPAAPQANGRRLTGAYVAPADIRAAYSVPASLTGSGQTVAIIMSATLSALDLQGFWTTADVAQSISNFTTIEVNGGPYTR